MQLDSRWYQGQRNDKDDRKATVLGGLPALKVLKNILITELDSVERKEVSLSGYDSPSWPYVQADYIAQKRVLKDVIALLTIEE